MIVLFSFFGVNQTDMTILTDHHNGCGHLDVFEIFGLIVWGSISFITCRKIKKNYQTSRFRYQFQFILTTSSYSHTCNVPRNRRRSVCVLKNNFSQFFCSAYPHLYMQWKTEKWVKNILQLMLKLLVTSNKLYNAFFLGVMMRAERSK